MLDFKFKKQHLFVLLLLSGIIIPSFLNLLYSVPIVLVIGYLLLKNKLRIYDFTLLDIGIAVLLLNEFITAIFSSYAFNSINSITRMLIISFSYLLFKRFLKEGKNYYLFLMFMFVLSSVLVILTLGYFKTFSNGVNEIGFVDLSDFKNLYSPIGKLSNIWGAFLLLTITFSLVLLLKMKKWEDKFLLFLNLSLTLFCLVVSFSRGVYISVIFLILFLGIVAFRFLKLKQFLILNLISIFILLASILIVKESFLTTVGFNKTVSQQRSTDGRVTLWKHSLNQLKEKPIFGFGQSNYIISNENQPLISEDVVFNHRTNNTFIQLLLERGIFGFCCYLLFFIIVVKIVWNSLKSKELKKSDKIQNLIILAGLFAFLLREFTFSSFFESNFVNVIAFHLIFLLIPYDINLKQIKFTKKIKNRALFVASILFLLVVLLNAKRKLISNYNQNFISAYNNDNIETSIKNIDKALFLASNDLTLNKNKAFAFSKNNLSIHVSSENQYLLKITTVNKDSLNEAKAILQKVLLKRPNDHGTLHNLGWFYLSENKYKEAETNFKKSLKQSPYNVEYHSSLILSKVVQSKLNEVVDLLSKVLQYSPDVLESPFYIELHKKYSSIAEKSKTKAISELKEKLKTYENNPIYMARLARLLLNEEKEEAIQLLTKVNNILPNLNRPRLYLGYLKSLENDSISAKEYFNKAKFLVPTDYLNFLYEGNFQKQIGNQEEAIKNYESLINMYKSFTSTSNYNNSYWSRMPSIKNGIIPKELLYYTKPKFDAERIFKYIETYYRKSNDLEKAVQFQKASKKYTNELFMGYID